MVMRHPTRNTRCRRCLQNQVPPANTNINNYHAEYTPKINMDPENGTLEGGFPLAAPLVFRVYVSLQWGAYEEDLRMMNIQRAGRLVFRV